MKKTLIALAVATASSSGWAGWLPDFKGFANDIKAQNAVSERSFAPDFDLPGLEGYSNGIPKEINAYANKPSKVYTNRFDKITSLDPNKKVVIDFDRMAKGDGDSDVYVYSLVTENHPVALAAALGKWGGLKTEMSQEWAASVEKQRREQPGLAPSPTLMAEISEIDCYQPYLRAAKSNALGVEKKTVFGRTAHFENSLDRNINENHVEAVNTEMKYDGIAVLNRTLVSQRSKLISFAVSNKNTYCLKGSNVLLNYLQAGAEKADALKGKSQTRSKHRLQFAYSILVRQTMAGASEQDRPSCHLLTQDVADLIKRSVVSAAARSSQNPLDGPEELAAWVKASGNLVQKIESTLIADGALSVTEAVAMMPFCGVKF